MSKNKPKTQTKEKTVRATKPKTFPKSEIISKSKQDVVITPEVQVTSPAVSEENKTPRSRKIELNTWVSITNLILLAISSVVVTLYLNYRNENFQEQLLDLKNKTEFANITTTYKNGIITVQNLGPAIAEDLRLVICLSTIAPKWANSISDVSSLNISIDNPAIESNVQTKNVNCNTRITGNNATQITINSLPPQQSFKILVKPSSNISLGNLSKQTEVYMSISDPSLIYGTSYATPTRKPTTSSSNQTPQSLDQLTIGMFTSSSLNDALEDYFLINELKIADFELSIACPNCNIDKKRITVSSFTHKEISGIVSIYDPNNKILRIDTTLYYYLPIDVNSDFPGELYLIAKMDNNNQTILVKSDKFEFVTPTPALSSVEICANGIDDNGDGKVDNGCPVLGCTDPTATNYNSLATIDNGSCKYSPPQCNDGIDNDGDGLIDLTDPQCSNKSDNAESG